MMLLDWQTNFYEPLKTIPRFEENYARLKMVLENDRWKERMLKKGIPFFSFLTHWVNYVETAALVSKNVVWQCLPGYNTLIKTLISGMKTREIS